MGEGVAAGEGLRPSVAEAALLGTRGHHEHSADYQRAFHLFLRQLNA